MKLNPTTLHHYFFLPEKVKIVIKNSKVNALNLILLTKNPQLSSDNSMCLCGELSESANGGARATYIYSYNIQVADATRCEQAKLLIKPNLPKKDVGRFSSHWFNYVFLYQYESISQGYVIDSFFQVIYSPVWSIVVSKSHFYGPKH